MKHLGTLLTLAIGGLGTTGEGSLGAQELPPHESSRPSAPKPLDPVTVTLSHADPGKAVQVLEEAFQPKDLQGPRDGERSLSNPRTTGSTKGVPDSRPSQRSPLVTSDAEHHALTIRGTAEELAFIQAFLREYDRETGARVELRRCPLRHASPATVAASIREVFGTVPESRPSGEPESSGPLVRTVGDSERRSVLILASPEDLSIILPVVTELDRPARSGSQVKLYRLRFTNPVKVKQVLEETLLVPKTPETGGARPPNPPGGSPADPPASSEKPASPPGGSPPADPGNEVSILVDVLSSTMYVEAPTGMIPVIDGLIRQLDLPTAETLPRNPLPKGSPQGGGRHPRGHPVRPSGPSDPWGRRIA